MYCAHEKDILWIRNADWLTEVKDRPLTEWGGREIYKNKKKVTNEKFCWILTGQKVRHVLCIQDNWSQWIRQYKDYYENEPLLSAEMKASYHAPVPDWPNLQLSFQLSMNPCWSCVCLKVCFARRKKGNVGSLVVFLFTKILCHLSLPSQECHLFRPKHFNSAILKMLKKR